MNPNLLVLSQQLITSVPQTQNCSPFQLISIFYGHSAPRSLGSVQGLWFFPDVLLGFVLIFVHYFNCV